MADTTSTAEAGPSKPTVTVSSAPVPSSSALNSTDSNNPDPDPVLTLDEVRALGRERIRPYLIRCQVKTNGKACVAMLASDNLLAKHVKKVHVDKLAQLSEDERPKVQWGNVSVNWDTPEMLLLQLEAKIEMGADKFCAVKDCPHPLMHSAAHYLNNHREVRLSMLRPSVMGSRPPLPALPPLPGPLPPYLISAPIIQPSRAPLPELEHPIVDRRPMAERPPTAKMVPFALSLSSDFYEPPGGDSDDEKDDNATLVGTPRSTSVTHSSFAHSPSSQRTLVPQRDRSHSVFSDASWGQPSPAVGRRTLPSRARNTPPPSSLASWRRPKAPAPQVAPLAPPPLPVDPNKPTLTTKLLVVKPRAGPDPIPSLAPEGKAPLTIRPVTLRLTHEIPDPVDYILAAAKRAAADRVERERKATAARAEREERKAAEEAGVASGSGSGSDTKPKIEIQHGTPIPPAAPANDKGKGKGKGKRSRSGSGRPAPPKRPRVDPKIIERAAREWAHERTGSWFGFDYLQHRIAFTEACKQAGMEDEV